MSASTSAAVSTGQRRWTLVIATWPSVVYPEGVAVAGDKLLAVSWMDDLVGVYDARTGQSLSSVELGRNPRGFGRFIHRPAAR